MLFHRYLIVLILSAILTVFSGCFRGNADKSSEIPKEPVQRFVPEQVSTKDTKAAVSVSLEQKVSDLMTQTRIPINPEDYLLQVINMNLDIDQIEEQIIVYKKKNDPVDRIRLMIADFDNVRNTYVNAWQGETQGTNNRSFTVYFQDILGDHISEILCFGRNDKGEQTLDIFRKAPSPQGFGIFYNSIASISSPGSIEIEERRRSEAYQLLQRNDESFPIAVYTTDPDSSNIIDLVKTTFYWSHQDGRYILGKTEKIPGQLIAEKQLTDLFSKNASDFEIFLSGPWYKVKSGTGSPPRAADIIHFDNKERKIVFYDGEIQEIFNWSSSYRTIYRGLYINSSNEAISNITKQLSLSISGMDSFDLQIKGGEGWDGQYRRLGKELQTSFFDSRSSGVKIDTLKISGIYRNEGGIELYFAAPHFTLRENGRTISGGYVIYSFNGEILELKILKENGLVDSTRTYKIHFIEEIRGNQIVRNLTLQPVTVSSRGVDIKTGGTIKLEQILEKES
jgi:hypothetical protein